MTAEISMHLTRTLLPYTPVALNFDNNKILKTIQRALRLSELKLVSDTGISRRFPQLD